MFVLLLSGALASTPTCVHEGVEQAIWSEAGSCMPGWTCRWSASCRRRIDERDRDGDGRVDCRNTWVFEPFLRDLRFEMDRDCDRVADLVTVTTYDALGRGIRSWKHDKLSDGEGAISKQLVEVERRDDRVRWTVDYHADGSVEWTYTTFLDAGGRVTSKRAEYRGVCRWIEHYGYDDRGLKIREDEDRDCDGVIDHTCTHAPCRGDLGQACPSCPVDDTY